MWNCFAIFVVVVVVVVVVVLFPAPPPLFFFTPLRCFLSSRALFMLGDPRS